MDPLTASYPMLTPYQFASNTPIQAIDLDGLEAATFQFEVRAIAGPKLAVTSSITIGIMAVKGPEGQISVSSFLTPSLGGGAGAGFSFGFSGSFYPTVTDPQQLSGIGANTGAFAGLGLPVVSGGIEANLALDISNAKLKGGGTLAPGVTGIAVGGGAYAEFSYTHIFKTVTKDEFLKNPLVVFGEETNLEKYGLSSQTLSDVGKQLIDQVKDYDIPDEISRLEEQINKIKEEPQSRSKPSRLRSVKNKISELRDIQSDLDNINKEQEDNNNE